MEAAFVLACFSCEDLEHARMISDIVKGLFRMLEFYGLFGMREIISVSVFFIGN